jgi:hypothetical protein
MIKKFLINVLQKLPQYYLLIMAVVLISAMAVTNVYASQGAVAGTDIWAKGKEMIIDIYNKIVGISTVLAALMSAIAVIGAKLSNNQHKVDQAWDWLRRIWIAWAIINGIGAFIAYVTPLFDGLHTLS